MHQSTDLQGHERSLDHSSGNRNVIHVQHSFSSCAACVGDETTEGRAAPIKNDDDPSRHHRHVDRVGERRGLTIVVLEHAVVRGCAVRPYGRVTGAITAASQDAGPH